MLYNVLPLFAEGAPAAQPGPGGLGMFLPFIIIIAIFYFMMIKPQQRKEKERKKEIEALRSGARILFGGGLIGTIVETKESTFLVEIASGVVVEIARGAVIRTLKDGEVASLDEAK